MTDFEERHAPVAPDDERLVVDVDGFEGPLDLLLELARRQKVDLTKISILSLAEQYLAFVEAARAIRLELAADYLVMAAWLTYLKSRLLLPAARKDEPEAAELAADLAARLRHLEAIRVAARFLDDRPQLGRDVAVRGTTDMQAPAAGALSATIYDLVTAYLRERQRRVVGHVEIAKRTAWSLLDAREVLLDGRCGPTWETLDGLLAPFLADKESRSGVRASAFSVALELAREGRIEVHQEAAFAPLWLRMRRHAPAEEMRP